MGLILVVLLVFLCLGTLPLYAYSQPWGYRPSGLLALALLALVILLFIGLIPWGFSRPAYFYRPVEVVRQVEVVNPAPGTLTNQVPAAPTVYYKEMHEGEVAGPRTVQVINPVPVPGTAVRP